MSAATRTCRTSRPSATRRRAGSRASLRKCAACPYEKPTSALRGASARTQHHFQKRRRAVRVRCNARMPAATEALTFDVLDDLLLAHERGHVPAIRLQPGACLGSLV